MDAKHIKVLQVCECLYQAFARRTRAHTPVGSYGHCLITRFTAGLRTLTIELENAHDLNFSQTSVTGLSLAAKVV